MNLGVDSFIPNPVRTSQCLELKDHSSHCGQLSGQSGSYQPQSGGWRPDHAAVLTMRPTHVLGGALCEKDTGALTQTELRFPDWVILCSPTPRRFHTQMCVPVLKQEKISLRHLVLFLSLSLKSPRF